MMVVKVEVWPGGDESRAREIERLYVWNESGLADISDYGYRFDEPPTLEESHGRITGHQRSDGAWELVRHILVCELGLRFEELP